MGSLRPSAGGRQDLRLVVQTGLQPSCLRSIRSLQSLSRHHDNHNHNRGSDYNNYDDYNYDYDNHNHYHYHNNDNYNNYNYDNYNNYNNCNYNNHHSGNLFLQLCVRGWKLRMCVRNYLL